MSAPGLSVLIIEDDAGMAGALRTLLEMEGCQATVAQDQTSQEAILAAARAVQPAIILLDVHLRNLTGFQIVAALRADPQLAGARVVMTSGMDVGARCLAAGADAFLLKPFMPDEMFDRLFVRE